MDIWKRKGKGLKRLEYNDTSLMLTQLAKTIKKKNAITFKTCNVSGTALSTMCVEACNAFRTIQASKAARQVLRRIQSVV